MTDHGLDDTFASMFGTMFGQTLAHSADIPVSLEISDEEAAAGLTREVAFTRTTTCTACDGRGGATPSDVLVTCPACNGEGGRTRAHGFFTVKTTCEACQGRGATVANPCPTCTGRGAVPTPATAAVTVPAGAQVGTVLRLEGQGNTLLDGTRGALVVWLLVGDQRTQLTDVQDAFTRMMIEPNVPRAIVRQPRGDRRLTPPQILAIVIGAVLLVLGLVR